jgi:uncharacterized C2H2 Zn-finger protein
MMNPPFSSPLMSFSAEPLNPSTCRCLMLVSCLRASLQHMRSSKKAHRDLDDGGGSKAAGASSTDLADEYECPECCIVFRDRAAQLRHMNAEHNSKRRSYHCPICDVLLKNEAAFKSHNSKLHLERSSRTFYCRECDQVSANHVVFCGANTS